MTSLVHSLLFVLCFIAKIHEINGSKENNCPTGCQCNHVLMTETRVSFNTPNIHRHYVDNRVLKRGTKSQFNLGMDDGHKIQSGNDHMETSTLRTGSRVLNNTNLGTSFETSSTVQDLTAPLPLAVMCQNLQQVPFIVDGTKIITLQLTNTSFHSLHANFTSKFPNLEWLSMSNTGLQAIVPGSLQALPRLRELWIYNCHHALTLDQDAFTGSNYITKITIQHCKLQTVDKSLFATLKSLRFLDLSSNNLTSTSDATQKESGIPVPPSWGLQLPANIQELNLSHNNIINLERLSSESLVSLDLCFNTLPTIEPEQITLPSLVALCIGGPQLELTTGLLTKEKFPQLTRLGIKGTKQKQLQVKDKPARDLKKIIKEKLYTLELENCMLFEPQLVMRMPGSAIQHLKVINSTVIAMRTSRNIFNLSTIAMLDFSGTPFLAQAFLNPPPYVQVNTSFSHLTTLVLTNTNTRKFHGNLFSRLPLLTELDISNNPLECTCENFGWLLGYVALNRLKLLNANTTECAFPEYMKGKLILNQNFCSNTPEDTDNASVSPINKTMEQNNGDTEGENCNNSEHVTTNSSKVITADGCVNDTAPEYSISPLMTSRAQTLGQACCWSTVCLLITVATTIYTMTW